MELSSDLLIDLVINIASILVLFLIVKKLAYKPVKKYMTERTQRIVERETAANELAEQAKQKEAEYTELIKNSDSFKAEAVRNAEAQARVQAQQIVDNDNKKAEQIISAAEKKSADEYELMLENGRDEMVKLSVEISSKLLERNIDSTDNRRAVEAFFAALDGGKNA